MIDKTIALYKEYCLEIPKMHGVRRPCYKSWLERQIIELRENKKECSNCGNVVQMISLGEMCPVCKC